jgi:hypothetical protein
MEKGCGWWLTEPAQKSEVRETGARWEANHNPIQATTFPLMRIIFPEEHAERCGRSERLTRDPIGERLHNRRKDIHVEKAAPPPDGWNLGPSTSKLAESWVCEAVDAHRR